MKAITPNDRGMGVLAYIVPVVMAVLIVAANVRAYFLARDGWRPEVIHVEGFRDGTAGFEPVSPAWTAMVYMMPGLLLGRAARRRRHGHELGRR